MINYKIAQIVRNAFVVFAVLLLVYAFIDAYAAFTNDDLPYSTRNSESALFFLALIAFVKNAAMACVSYLCALFTAYLMQQLNLKPEDTEYVYVYDEKA